MSPNPTPGFPLLRPIMRAVFVWLAVSSTNPSPDSIILVEVAPAFQPPTAVLVRSFPDAVAPTRFVQTAASAGGANAKVALTRPELLTVRLQAGSVPEQAPVQPVKTEMAEGAAVKVSDVPWRYARIHVLGEVQLSPGGALYATEPPAPSAPMTVRSRRLGPTNSA